MYVPGSIAGVMNREKPSTVGRDPGTFSFQDSEKRDSEMPEFDYKKYLASREWAIKKEAIAKRCSGFCERCAVGSYESTHHVTYKNIGNEPLDDLLAVCNECHAFLSAKSDYDPAMDIILFVIAINRKHSSDTKLGWTRQLAADGGRVVGTTLPSGIDEHDFAGRMPVWLWPGVTKDKEP